MARTKKPPANLDDKARAAARARTERKIAALRRAGRMLSSQEVARAPEAEAAARAHTQ